MNQLPENSLRLYDKIIFNRVICAIAAIADENEGGLYKL